MRKRLASALVVAAVVSVPLAFDPASSRPFVGPKLVAALALGALAPAAAVAAGGLSRLSRGALVAFGAHAAALALATAGSLAPAMSFAGDYYRGMGFVTRAALIALAVVAGALVAADASRAVVFLRAMLAASALVAVYAIVQALRLDPIVDPSLLMHTSRAGVTEFRVVSTLGHANFVGHFLLFGAGAAVALAGVAPPRAARIAALGCGALVALGAVVSGSRGAWAGLAIQAVALACLAVPAFGRPALTPRRLAAAAGVVLAAVAVGAPLARGPVGEQVALRALEFRLDGMTGSNRTVLWRDALPMVARYAAHGCGPEAFVLAFLPYTSAELERGEPYAIYDSAHDVLLDAAISTGAAGAATVVALFAVAAVALRRAFRSLPKGRERALPLGLALALVGYAVGGLFVFDTIPTALYFYLFVAVSVGLVPRPAGTARGAAWRAPVAGVLLVAAVAFVWPRLRLVWSADRQMATATARAEVGRLPEAIAFGRAAVENGRALGPAAELGHMLARIYARVGDPTRAPTDEERALIEAGIAEVDRALPYATTPQLLRAERADLLLRCGRVDEARADLGEAVRLAPAFWPARVRLARLLVETGDAEGARREAAAALDLNPESADARAVLDEAASR
jgi:tetratricopeptide (TPR) repeat protein